MREEKRSRPEEADIAQLAAFGAPGGPSLEEALQLFARLRARPGEGRAIAQLLTLEARSPLPEPLLVAVASALVDRGEAATATRALARANSSAALMLRADLIAGLAGRAGPAGGGDLPLALTLVERVLLRDLDWPGARERHARWRGALGVPERPRAPDAEATLMTGEPDAPFRLVREVGRGGAGAVYEAEDRELGRRVALKVYHHRHERDRAQLLHEARVAVALAGPGIVRVFDVDADNGWLAMEWARLGTLRALLRGGGAGNARFRPIRGWAAPLARSLARVHAQGWVHHDVKPANILLAGGEAQDDAAPLLSDFGTARRIGEPSPPGSLGYVSPERLAGRPSSPRDDVYAFGRVLQEALDVIDATDAGGAQSTSAGACADVDAWRALASACTGPDELRPESGADLVSRCG
jgi:serine/threonine-protein kinase